MKLNLFRYYIKQGFHGVTQNRLMSVASIGTTIATLFILGVFIVLSANANYFADQVSRDCEIQAFITAGSTPEEYQAIEDQIKGVPGIASVERYTKEQIFEEMRNKLKEKATVLDGLENDNPFRDSFKISLSDLSATAQVTEAISQIPGVENTTDFQEAAGMIVNISNGIKNVSFWVVIVLCIIAAFIISNTIKLSVFARRKEINIMKYIGATDWFIRWPFVIEGVLIGFIGAIFSFLIIWGVYARAYSSFHFQGFQLLHFNMMVWILLAAFFAVGGFIGAVGSIISIRKHLKV